MVDLPVEFEPHPVSHIAGVKQICGATDHVVEIDNSLSMFAFGILVGKRLADEKRFGQAVGIVRPAQLFE